MMNHEAAWDELIAPAAKYVALEHYARELESKLGADPSDEDLREATAARLAAVRARGAEA